MKKHLLILTLFVWIFSCCGIAQVTFQKAIGVSNLNSAYSVLQTTDSGYIAVGITQIITDHSTYLIKTNAGGDLLWAKTYSFSGPLWGFSVQQTYDGGYIITGFITTGICLIKTNAGGDTLWNKIYKVSGAIGYSVQQTYDSGFIIVGSRSAPSDAILIKTNSSGNPSWSKTYGGLANDEAYSVQQTIDSGYIMVGYTKSFGTGSADVYLIKTDNIGDTLWTRVYGGVLGDFGNSVKQTSDGGYIVSGSTNSFGTGGSDVYLIKTDNIGNALWSKTFGGTGNDGGSSVQQTTDMGYIISGTTNSFGNGAYLIKTDSTGNAEWSKVIAGAGFSSVEQTNDGGYIACGSVGTLAGNVDFLLVKTDSKGNTRCNEYDASTITTSPATITSDAPVNIASISFPFLSNSIYIGSGGTDTTLCATVGLNEIIASPSMLVSPNPSSGSFVITFPDAIKKGMVEIYNACGQRIFSETIYLTSKKDINLGNVPAGMYFLKVSDGTTRYTQKIIIE
jgi:hypothetical protein